MNFEILTNHWFLHARISFAFTVLHFCLVVWAAGLHLLPVLLLLVEWWEERRKKISSFSSFAGLLVYWLLFVAFLDAGCRILVITAPVDMSISRGGHCEYPCSIDIPMLRSRSSAMQHA